MTSKIFVNLPVSDLSRARTFFSKLGFTFNAQFSDETAACMIIGTDNCVMLLTHAKFSEFSKKKIVDARTSAEMLLAVSFESRARVDDIMTSALAAGAVETRPPADYGFMYQRSFDDLDGHTWEAFHMDESFVQKP
jgi:predicted lactoylglutathione lyase